jgi:hypothetical protein
MLFFASGAHAMDEHPLKIWVGQPITAYIAAGHTPVEPQPGAPVPELEEGERRFYFRFNPYDPRYPENLPNGAQTDAIPKDDRYVISTRKQGDSGTLADYIIDGYGAPNPIYE